LTHNAKSPIVPPTGSEFVSLLARTSSGHRTFFKEKRKEFHVADLENDGSQLPIELELLRDRVNELEARCKRAEDALHALEERNHVLGNSAPFGIFFTDNAGRVSGANQRILDMLSWPETGEISALNVLEHPGLAETGAAYAIRRCIKTGVPVVSDHPCLPALRECTDLRYHISPIFGNDGAVVGALAFVDNVTELKRAEEATRQSEEKYRLLFESAPIAMIERDASALKSHLDDLQSRGLFDLQTYLFHHPDEVKRCMAMIKTVDYNKGYLHLMEAGSKEEVNIGLQQGYSEEFLRAAREVILMVAGGNISVEREETFVSLKGTKRSVLVKALPISGHEDTFSRVVIALTDITNRKQAEEALRASEQRFREQAMKDNLTGLYNRRYLYRSLAELIQEGKDNGSVVSIIFLDLDDFKQVVDTHGHLNGSRAIQEVASTIRESLKEPAYAVAYAGDEFVIVLPGFDRNRALLEAEEIRSRIVSTGYLLDQGLEVRLTATFGIAMYPEDAGDVTGLLASADTALFAGKKRGKDSIRVYTGQGR
jgi:diguanylate cyclase (GGDEF)-like protein